MLWLWHRPAATAPISPLAWESPFAAGTALKRQKTKKKKKERKKEKKRQHIEKKKIFANHVSDKGLILNESKAQTP